MYEKKTNKQFILSCHEHINDDYVDKPIETDDFFELGAEVVNKRIDQMYTEYAIFLIELELAAKTIRTFKEFNLFLLMVEGKTYKDMSCIFVVGVQIVKHLLEKL